MRVDPFCLSLDCLAYRIIPDDPANDPLDSSFAALADRNRWNLRGEPTLYLGRDPRVLATEWARHVADEIKDPAIAGGQRRRRIFEVRVRLDLVLDLRDPALGTELSLSNVPFCFAERRDVCQQTSSRLRHETAAYGLITPAIGLLDQPERWVLVVFTDKLPSYPQPFLSDVKADGTLPSWFEWAKQ